MGFWNNDHPLSKEMSRIWDQYVPMSGPTEYVETELLRAANRIMYDWYNNGWGVNNKTAELEFLQSHNLFEKITPEDLAYQNGDKFEEYMDDELAAIIELIVDAEESDSLTPLEGDPLTELGIDHREWDRLSAKEDDEDAWYDDDDYYEERSKTSSKSRLTEYIDHPLYKKLFRTMDSFITLSERLADDEGFERLLSSISQEDRRELNVYLRTLVPEALEAIAQKIPTV